MISIYRLIKDQLIIPRSIHYYQVAHCEQISDPLFCVGSTKFQNQEKGSKILMDAHTLGNFVVI